MREWKEVWEIEKVQEEKIVTADWCAYHTLHDATVGDSIVQLIAYEKLL